MAPMAVMATHSTTTLAATGGSFGRDERRGADSGDGGDSKHCLADHRSLQVFIGCVLTSAYSVARMIRRVLQRADLRVSNRLFRDGHHRAPRPGIMSIVLGSRTL